MLESALDCLSLEQALQARGAAYTYTITGSEKKCNYVICQKHFVLYTYIYIYIKLTALMEKFEILEASLIAVTREKEALKVTVAEQAGELAELRNSLNEREQYARSWSMRILNIPVHKDQ